MINVELEQVRSVPLQNQLAAHCLQLLPGFYIYSFVFSYRYELQLISYFEVDIDFEYTRIYTKGINYATQTLISQDKNFTQ